jgi:uncharacterized phage protein (TIGR02218 family)
MRTIPAGLVTHLTGTVTTLALCWRLERRDGQVFGATNHDRDLTIAGELYRADAGATPGAIEQRADLSVPGLEIQGVLDDAALLAADLMAGLYDGAAVRVFVVNWQDPDGGEVELMRGTTGEVRRRGGAFIAELRGLAQALQQTVGEVLTPTCRADLGDARCGVDLGPLTVAGTLSGVTSRRILADSARAEADDYWNGGLLTMTDGLNAGYAREVAVYAAAGGALELFEALPHLPTAGDAYTLAPGCDKRLATCSGRYANAVNFRGEPAIPGQDELARYGGS